MMSVSTCIVLYNIDVWLSTDNPFFNDMYYRQLELFISIDCATAIENANMSKTIERKLLLSRKLNRSL